MKARFSQKMVGEHKAVMEAISHIIHKPVQYTRAPRFAYVAGWWSIDREGVLTSPIFGMESGSLFCADLMGALGKQGFAAEGPLTVTILPERYDEGCLANIQAMLAAKGTLLRHALGVDTLPDAHAAMGDYLAEYELSGGYVFPFFPAATTFPGILSALQLAERVAVQAAMQKRVTAKEREVLNEKYAMRCFLLRIGMIGRPYAVARKELLRRLPGDSSFKSGARPASSQSPEDCLSCGHSLSEPGVDGGPDRLVCSLTQEYVKEDGRCAEYNR